MENAEAREARLRKEAAFKDAETKGNRKNTVKIPAIETLQDMIALDDIEEFIGAYFSRDFRAEVNYYVQGLRAGKLNLTSFWLPKIDDGKKLTSTGTFQRFAKQDDANALREQETSTFTEKTALALKEIMLANPIYAYTCIGLRNCFEQYIDKGTKELATLQGTAVKDRPDDDPLLRLLSNAANSGSFFGEILPHILIELANTENNEDTSTIYQNGLKGSFTRQAWQSAHDKKIEDQWDAPGTLIIKCPVSKIINKLWRTIYTIDEHGIYHPSDEKRDGALPAFIHNRIEELESTEPKLIGLKL